MDESSGIRSHQYSNALARWSFHLGAAKNDYYAVGGSPAAIYFADDVVDDADYAGIVNHDLP